MRNDAAASGLSYIALAVYLALCFAVAAVGGAVTASSVATWYANLTKPAFNPPDWLFGPVWTMLYAMIAIAGWRIWLRRREPGAGIALGAWSLQLVLNLAWSLIFFGARMIGAALLEIVVLLAVILFTTVYLWRVDRLAGALFVPYAMWVAFATALNAALWQLNP
jgi:tryptophan-rich sensory protein